jgi:hypothetical protein
MSDIEHDTFDTGPTEELSRNERRLLEVADALDAASAPRTDTERDGVGINLELTLPDRVQWLVERLKDARDQLATTNQVLRNHGAPMDELTIDQGATWVGRELTAQCRRGDESEVHLSELHIKLRQMFDAESVAEALEEAATLKTQRDVFMRQRDEAIAKVSAAVDDAAELATENLLQERTIAKLIVKIKRLQERSTPKPDKSPKSCAKPKTRKR